MSKFIVAVAATAAFLSLSIRSSPAQFYGNAPWCAVIELGNGGLHWDCQYRTVEECVPQVLAGNRGSCNVNPYFAGSHTAGNGAPAAQSRHHASRHKHKH